MARVAVIMPVYNAGAVLEQAVASVLAQTMGDLQLVVVDDGSTDGAVDPLIDHRDRRIVVLTGSPNTGAAGARNRGLAVVDAPYVALADADDLMHPRRLERQCRYLDEHPETALVAGATEVFGARAGSGRVSVPVTTNAALTLGLRYGPSFFHGSVMVRTDALRSIEGYHDVPPAEDYDMYARLLLAGYGFGGITDVVLFYRDHDGGISKTRSDDARAVHRRTSDRLRASVGVPPWFELLSAARDEPADRNGEPRLRFLKLLGRSAAELWRTDPLGAARCLGVAVAVGPRSWARLVVGSRYSVRATQRRTGTSAPMSARIDGRSS